MTGMADLNEPSTPAAAVLGLARGYSNMTEAEAKRLEPDLSGQPVRCTQAVYDEAMDHADRGERKALRTMHSQRLLIITPTP